MSLVKFDGEYAIYKAIEFSEKYRLYLETPVTFGTGRSQKTKNKQKNRICRDLNISNYISAKNRISLGDLPDIERKYKVRLVIWTQKNQKDQLRKSLESMVKQSSNYPTINLLSVEFNPFLSQNLSDLSAILNLEEFLRSKKFNPAASVKFKEEMSFVAAISSRLCSNATYWNLMKKVESIKTKWPSGRFEIRDSKKFYAAFGIGIQVWTKTGNKVGRVFDSLYKNKLSILVELFDESLNFDDKIIFIRNIEVLNFYSCERKYCFYGSNNYTQYMAHIRRCTDTTKISYKQKLYSSPSESIKEALVSEAIIPSMLYENMYYCAYDIETSMDIDKSSGIANLMYIHKLLSIGIKSNFGIDNEFFLIRKDTDPESLKELIKTFVKTLYFIKAEMRLLIDNSIFVGLEKYIEIRKSAEFKVWFINQS
jgi:hypothetical protein